LNVFVPKKVLESDNLAPVIFYIHGGAFMFGGSSYYLPEHIMDYGKLILVTINYRLGVLGFLSTEDEVLPGNLGMKDQVQALKWVQRNIKAFKGDAEKVTLVGYSAGAASVQMHYMSPLSQGLFKNGISHSGTALNPWVFMEKGRKKSHKIAEYMDCTHDDHQKMLECLRQKPVEELVMTLKEFQPFLYNPFSPLGLVVEPVHESAFISEDPRIVLKNGKFSHRPWLFTQVKDEGLYPGAEFYSKEEFLDEIDRNWESIAPYILHYNDDTDNHDKLATASRMIRNFYMADDRICRKNFKAFINVGILFINTIEYFITN
jgi:carboxylesterase type B